MKRVAIVGGGITGLATAYFLQEGARALHQPLEIVLIEGSSRLGGKIYTEQTQGFLIEGGPDSFLTQKPWALQLCKRLNLADQLVAPQPGKTYVLLRGQLRRLPEGAMGLIPTRLGSFVKSELFSLWGKLRMGLDLFIPPRRDGQDESLGEFIRRRLGSEALARLAEPLLAGVYAADADHLSLLATFPRLRDLERQHGSLIKGAISQQRAPSRLSPQPLFMTLRPGLSTLVDALRAQLQIRVVAGERVVQVARAGTSYKLTLAHGQRIEAHEVVLTTPAYVTAQLLEPLSLEAAQLLAAIPYASTAVVTLAFRQADVEHPLDGTGFVVPRLEGTALTACTWSSAKWPSRAPAGFVLLRSFFGRAGQEDVLRLNDEELCQLAYEELKKLLGLQRKPILARVHRHFKAMPQYQVGHLERLTQIEEALSEIPGLLLAGAAYRGIGLPDCIRQAEDVAGRLLHIPLHR